MAKEKKVEIEVTLDKDVIDVLERVAKKMKTSFNDIVETILRYEIIGDCVQEVHREREKKAKKA